MIFSTASWDLITFNFQVYFRLAPTSGYRGPVVWLRNRSRNEQNIPLYDGFLPLIDSVELRIWRINNVKPLTILNEVYRKMLLYNHYCTTLVDARQNSTIIIIAYLLNMNDSCTKVMTRTGISTILSNLHYFPRLAMLNI